MIIVVVLAVVVGGMAVLSFGSRHWLPPSPHREPTSLLAEIMGKEALYRAFSRSSPYPWWHHDC
jgi:hypothetical protein